MRGTYLTPCELQDLTGYRIRSAVMRWLDRNGWPYAAPGADGWPRVLRQYHDDRMSGHAVSRLTKRKSEPNWSTA